MMQIYSLNFIVANLYMLPNWGLHLTFIFIFENQHFFHLDVLGTSRNNGGGNYRGRQCFGF